MFLIETFILNKKSTADESQSIFSIQEYFLQVLVSLQKIILVRARFLPYESALQQPERVL